MLLEAAAKDVRKLTVTLAPEDEGADAGLLSDDR